MEASGVNGQVQFDGTFVTITRSGFLARSTIGKGEKRIPLASITAVQWKQPGALVNGYIAFTLAGGNEKQARSGSQTIDAGKDENAVIVTKKQAPAFEQLRSEIEGAIAARHAPAAPAVAASGADEVARLAQLHAAGHLTDAEYSAAKAKALGL